MGRLVVIEGLDGAGKRTLADRLSRTAVAAASRGSRSPATPRTCTPSSSATRSTAAWATSRRRCTGWPCCSRWTAGPPPRPARGAGGHDVVLVDRYVASNAAYGAARLHEGAAGEFVGWVRALEVERFGIPVPDHQLHLAVPPEVAAARAAVPGADRRPRPRRLRGRRRPAEAHGGGVRRARRGGVAEPRGPVPTAAADDRPRRLAADPPLRRVSDQPLTSG